MLLLLGSVTVKYESLEVFLLDQLLDGIGHEDAPLSELQDQKVDDIDDRHRDGKIEQHVMLGRCDVSNTREHRTTHSHHHVLSNHISYLFLV